MKNVMKKLVSIFTITAIAVSMLCTMPIASAAVLYTEDFSDAALPAEYEVTHKPGYECPTHGLQANKNTITVEDEQLKFFIAGKETYKGIEGHELGIDNPNSTQLNGHSSGHMAGQLSYGHFNSTLKIPLSNLPTSGVYTISFDYHNPSGYGSVNWLDLASIYNSDGKRVLRGRSFANSANVNMGGYGQLSEISWAGYSTSEKTGTADVDSYDKGIGASITNNVTKVTFTLDVDNGKASVDIGGTYAGDIYFINDMTASGYLYFDCFLSNYSTKTGAYSDTTIYFDNFEIKEIIDYTAIPVELDMSSDEMYKWSNDNLANTYGNSAAIIAEPDNTENKVLAVTIPKADTTKTSRYIALSNISFPYSGLADDENLKVSYRYKNTTENATLLWQYFGTIRNSAELDVVRGLGYDFSTGFCTVDNYSATNGQRYINFAGYDNNTHTKTALASSDKDQKGLYFRVENKDKWWTYTYVFDRENERVDITVEYDGAVIAEDYVYTINELPSSGELFFQVSPSWNLREYSADLTFYIDDVKMETWKPLAVEETNLVETDFDAEDDIELTFNQDVADFDAVKQAITITEADGTEVEASRISVTGSSNVATVKVAGGLKYGETTYTLTLDANVIKSVDGLMLTKEYTKEFTTKLGKSVYVSSATDLLANATTITITNPEASAKDVWVVLALYSSTNKLIGYAEGELKSVAATTTTDPITLTATDVTGEVATAKVLLWDSSSSLIPYHIPVVVAE